MPNNLISFLLYPVKKLDLSEKQKDLIKEKIKEDFKEFKDQEIDEALNNPPIKDLKEVISKINENEKKKYFTCAKKVIESIDYSKIELEGLSELGKLLKIDSKDTGFAFDLYNMEDINIYEFQKTIRRFSIVSAAIGFIPIPIADIAILTPLQIGMIAKIANINNFKIDPTEFLKMLIGTIGAGILFRIAAKVLNNFIPVIGWGINAAIAFSGTYAIGIITKSYIEADGKLTSQTIKEIWNKSLIEGKKEFVNLKDYIFKKKDELLKELEKYKNKMEDKKPTTTTIISKPKSSKKKPERND